MSILEFAKHLGRQVFDRDDMAAERIKQHIDVSLSKVENLDVEYDDGTVTLCGECLSVGDRERAILMAGNIEGVEKVVAEGLTAPAPMPEEPEVKTEFYEIKSGDTLGGIAKQFYGKASKYTEIFEANRDVIDDPNKIYPGQKIRIPLH